MKIIPVIDLKDGQVVLAKQGLRHTYQPIHSPLCHSADIIAVIEAFLSVYSFNTFYIADLNAIMQQGNNDDLIAHIVTYYPTLTFWVDKGFQRYCTYPHNYYPVLGSECYNDTHVDIIHDFKKRYILSLDYNASGELGAKSFFKNISLWSDNIIIMSLHCVGSNQGADIIRLREFCLNYSQKNFIAAGGIRDISDLKQLKSIGIHQVLMASALHSKAINYDDIVSLFDF